MSGSKSKYYINPATLCNTGWVVPRRPIVFERGDRHPGRIGPGPVAALHDGRFRDDTDGGGAMNVAEPGGVSREDEASKNMSD